MNRVLIERLLKKIPYYSTDPGVQLCPVSLAICQTGASWTLWIKVIAEYPEGSYHFFVGGGYYSQMFFY